MFERIAVSLTQVKQKLKDKKYRDEKSGRDIAFSTAYGRGNEKAISDFKQMKQELKAEEKKIPDTKNKKTITKKVKVEDLPKLDEKAVQSLMTMDSWMTSKKNTQKSNINKLKEEIKEIENDPKLKKAQKVRKVKEKNEAIKKESEINYAPLDKDAVATLGKHLKNTDLKKILPADNFDDFMSSFIKRNSELASTLKGENSRVALNTIRKLKGEEVEEDDDDFGSGEFGFSTKSKKKSPFGNESFGYGFDDVDEDVVEDVEDKKVVFEDVGSIIKKIKAIKNKESKEGKAELGELANQLAESLSIEHTLENVVLNPTTGLPKFRNKQMMTPKAMSKVYAQEQDRYGSLAPKDRNILVKKLEKKIEESDGAEKEVLEKAMDAAVTDIFFSSLKDPLSKENKLPKNRIITDPKIMYMADQYGRKDFVEKAAELTRTTDAKVHRDVMSSMLKSLSDDEFKKMITNDEESPLYDPFFELLQPDYCPVHPQNERSGTNVDDDECPVRLTEKERDDIKQKLIDLYQDTTFFIAGGINLEGYYDEDDNDVKAYNEKYKKVTSEAVKSTTKLNDTTKNKIKSITSAITNKKPDDIMQEKEGEKLWREMRSEVTQNHINTLGNIAVGLSKAFDQNKTVSNAKKMEWMMSAFETIPGFPKLN